MRFGHISDLHLGISLNEFSLIEDQKFILDEVVDILVEQKVDALLIAGDVYDKGIASIEAIRLFEEFLKKICHNKIKVFVISGNHDTAERLTFGRQFMESSGIYFSKVYDGTVPPVKLEDEHGVVNVYLLPFIKPASVRFYFSDEKIEGFNDALSVAIDKLEIDTEQRNILVAHQNILNVERCDSEGFVYGGLDGISADVFQEFDYTALGHIHGPQTIGKKKNIRYCGTPLKYSLSEKNHKKSVTIIDLEKKGDMKISTVELKPLRNLREIRGKFEEIMLGAQSSQLNNDDYVNIVLTDEEEIIDGFYKLRNVYPHVFHMNYDNIRTRNSAKVEQMGKVENLSPLELFDRFYENRNGICMSQEQKDYMDKLIQDIWETSK